MEGGPKQKDKLNIIAIVAVGAVGCLAVYASFVALQAFYEIEAREVEEERFAEGKGEEFRALQKEQRDEILSYRWISQADGTVSLTIDRAMELVVQEVAQGKSNDLVPKVGPHDTPTVPAVWGRPPDNVQMPPKPTEGAEGTAPEGAEGAAPEGAAPEGATPEGATPEGAAPAGQTPAQAPAGAAPAGQTPAPAPAGAAPAGAAPTDQKPPAQTPPAGGNAP